jgi:adenylosuccinate synthase
MSKHKIVVGLGFGDEGKGTIVDHLTSRGEYDFVVRFSGGPQAAHNVVTDDGLHHTFSQFGAGTFNGVPTILTRHMLVNPTQMEYEAQALSEKIDFDPFSKLIISENSLLITPWHMAFNQLQEIRRGEGRHGSCGQGIGVTQKFALDYPDLALRMKDLFLDRDSFVAKASIVQELLKAEYGKWTKDEFMSMNGYSRTDLVRTPGNVHGVFEYFMKDHNPLILPDEEIEELLYDSNCVWEGSQGVLLDEWKGFHPYTTWSTTTPHTALHILNDIGVNTEEDVEVIGVTRTYHTRHGAGPFPSEDPKLLEEFPEAHNGEGKFQGGWRVGALDFSLVEYAIDASERIDSIAMTHCDMDKYYITDSMPRYSLTKLSGDLEAQEKLATRLMGTPLPWRYEYRSLDYVIELLEERTKVPVDILSYGPATGEKIHAVDMEWVHSWN